MEFLLPVFYSIIFIVLILNTRFFSIEAVSRPLLVLLFLLKLVVAATVVWVYTSRYPGGDFFTYFSDSRVLLHNAFGAKEAYSEAWTGSFGDVLYNGSRSMILLNAALHLFSFGNFYVHVVFFCFFAFVGLVALLKSFLKHFPAKKDQLIIALFLIPSILFWGSAALKEPVIMGCTGLLILVTDFGLNRRYKPLQVFFVVLLLALLLLIKMYVLLALLPLLLVNAIVARTSANFLFLKYLFMFGFFIVLAVVIGCINPNYSALQQLRDKQAKAISEAGGGVFLADNTHFIRVEYERQDEILLPLNKSVFRLKPGSAYMQWPLDDMRDTTYVMNATDTSAFHLLYSIQPAHSVIALKRIKPGAINFINVLPMALVNTFIHPTVFEISSSFHLVIAMENVVMIILVLLALVFRDKTTAGKKEVLVFCILFALMIYMLTGLTTPAIGAMVRYKTIGLLFLAPACLLMISGDKLRRLFRK